jgi:cytochrome c-type biogenesis protein CcmE
MNREISVSNPLDQPLENDISAELKERKTGFGKSTIILGVAVLAIVAFVGGVFVQKSFSSAQTLQNAARQFNGTPPTGGQQRGNGGRGTIGTIDRIEGTTVYVKTMNGQIVKVSTSDSTKVEVTTEGKLDDLKAGQQVVVQGQAGEDGTVNGQTITQRPTTG